MSAGSQMLGVLDAPSQVRAVPAVRPESVFIDVQHFAIGAVANRVHRHLVVVLDRELGGPPQHIERSSGGPYAAGQIGIRLEQPGTVRSQGAVHRPFDGANGEVMVAIPEYLCGCQIDLREAIVARPEHHP